MRLSLVVAAVGAGTLATACRTSPPPATQAAAASAERSVFTDSALHAQRCAPTRAGEDWRTVCVPKDQRREVRPKP